MANTTYSFFFKIFGDPSSFLLEPCHFLLHALDRSHRKQSILLLHYDDVFFQRSRTKYYITGEGRSFSSRNKTSHTHTRDKSNRYPQDINASRRDTPRTKTCHTPNTQYTSQGHTFISSQSRQQECISYYRFGRVSTRGFRCINSKY